MTLRALVLRYAAFAVLATIVNLGAQRLVLAQGADGTMFILAVGVGTAAGLITKYLLDKRWIFHDRDTGFKTQGRKFSLYTAMGVVTTAIFWGMETAFWMIWNTHAMREVGALVGLGIGYVTKYQLDRRYVFTDSQKAVTA